MRRPNNLRNRRRLLDRTIGLAYVNVRNIHMSPPCMISSGRIWVSAYRWSGSDLGVHHGVRALGRDRQTGMDRPDDFELFCVVAARTGGARLSDREWANGMLD